MPATTPYAGILVTRHSDNRANRVEVRDAVLKQFVLKSSYAVYSGGILGVALAALERQWLLAFLGVAEYAIPWTRLGRYRAIVYVAVFGFGISRGAGLVATLIFLPALHTYVAWWVLRRVKYWVRNPLDGNGKAG
jgi:hypothetical protein